MICKTIEYEGEIIGDIMKRGSYTWINVHDDANAVGVWVPAMEMGNVKYSGQYKYTGDIIRVTGTFHRACIEHGGDMDIHAEKLEIVK